MGERTGTCPTCAAPVRLTTRGRLFVHAGPPRETGPQTYTVSTCPGSGQPPALDGTGPFYILSLKWSLSRDRYVTFWRPANCGYVWALTAAGRYTRDEVMGALAYYNDGDNTLAIPCDVVDGMAVPMDPTHSDYGDAPAVPFSRAALRALRRAAPIPPAPRYVPAEATHG